MNTKTSLKRVYNYYNGTDHGVGRDSPGALLDMLAEVASQTLHSEKNFTDSVVNDDKLQSSKGDLGKKKSQQEASFDSSQLLSMPATQLVKQFSVFTSDELKRQYSYTCALVPGCGQRYTSFASEGRARMSIKAHLADHLDYLKRDKEAYSTFTAVAVKQGRNGKGTQTSKKPRVNQQKKPGEALNKENKETKTTGKSTNYLRKILSNEMSFTEFEKEKNMAKTDEGNVQVKNESEDAELQVLGDHSYFEQVKTDDDRHKDDDPSQIMVNEAMGENIMLMVVESDGVHMKELPYIAQDISVRADQDDNETIYIPESVTWSEEVYAKNMEISAPAKPKGKAKFIGTSKEEREMALALMDRIKRKGNPAGGNLQCRICDPPRSFTAPTTLVSHYRSHAGIKPYECRICRAVFTRRHSLKYHMLIHQNQTRFTCADCGKKFRHPSHFREHRRRHTGEAPFGCEDCGQRFKTRNTYKRHLKTRHGKVLTTTGELLHLSEEDFQKVRTNPKRRNETNNSESMIDEDVTAPETILQLENQECSNDGDGDLIKEEADENYQLAGKENGDNRGANELWDNDNEDHYRDYEYFEKSQGNKTDQYTKTDIALDNCEFDNDVDKDEEDLTVNNDCISIAIQDENEIGEIELVKCEGAAFDESLDAQEEILYDENLSPSKSNLIDYVEGINVAECESEAYDDNVAVLQEGDNSYEVDGTQDEAEVDYFETNLSMGNAIEYKEGQLSMERYEEMQLVEEEDCEETCQSGEFVDCKGIVQEDEILVPRILDSENESEEKTDENRFLLDGGGVVHEEEVEEKARFPTHFLLQGLQPLPNDNKNPRANVAVERIIQYPTTNYEAEENLQSPHNMPRIYLQANQSSNNIIIKNKDLMSLLTQRIKLQQQNPENNIGSKNSNGGKVVTLLNSQPQSLNLVQNGKQGTLLLLSTNNDMKNDYLQIDANNTVANGIKTLPVIAVQQK